MPFCLVELTIDGEVVSARFELPTDSTYPAVNHPDNILVRSDLPVAEGEAAELMGWLADHKWNPGERCWLPLGDDEAEGVAGEVVS